MKFESVLIVTYGRSGSTLLMGILNSIPGMLVRGENLNLCAGLFSAYTALCDTKERYWSDSQDARGPFYGAYGLSPESFLTDARQLLKKQLVGEGAVNVSCWGFKEIRYRPADLNESGVGNLPDYLGFLSKLMPRPAFVFLTRDHGQVTKSAFWQGSEEDELLAQISTFEEQAKQWSNNRPDCFWIDYVDLVGDRKKLELLFDFIGEAYVEERVSDVLCQEHSYGGNPKNLSNVTKKKTKQLRVVTNPAHGMEVAKIDRHPHKITLNTPFELGGVVLPRAQSPSIASLMVEGCDGAIASLNVPSPWYGDNYPSNPHATNARFKIAGIKISGEGSLDIFVKFADQTRQLIAQLQVE